MMDDVRRRWRQREGEADREIIDARRRLAKLDILIPQARAALERGDRPLLREGLAMLVEGRAHCRHVCDDAAGALADHRAVVDLLRDATGGAIALRGTAHAGVAELANDPEAARLAIEDISTFRSRAGVPHDLVAHLLLVEADAHDVLAAQPGGLRHRERARACREHARALLPDIRTE